jgi:pimeloyl-ACP methyl ester carboxylesterase
MLIDLESLLPRINVPTLVVHRTQDVVPVEEGRFLASHIPSSRFYKHPRDVIFLDALPRNATGNAQKRSCATSWLGQSQQSRPHPRQGAGLPLPRVMV